jgi:syntaxin 16
MATKNLTRPFKSLRDGFDRQKGVRRLDSPAGALQDAKPLAAPPPFWVDTVSTIEETIKQIEDKIAKLHDAHKNRLLVRMDEGLDASRDKEIDMLTSQITKKFKEAEGQLKLIGNSRGRSTVGGGDDEAVQLNIQRSMATKLQQLSLTFRKSQKQYMTRVKMQKSGKTNLFSGDDDDEDEERGKRAARGDGQFTLSDAELLVLESETVNIKERDREIQKIATSIEELATIFKELGVLVIDQGTILDRIDYNMDAVVLQTTHAVKELQETEKIQKQAVPQKCITILLIIIFVLLVILVFKHS